MRLYITLILFVASNYLYSRSIDYLPVPSTNLVNHTYYTLSYNETLEQANWVCYTLTDSMVMNAGEERSNQFKTDPLVPTGSAKSSDYTKSGYDRGHLCPAGDMGFNPKAMLESFMMSNISPQKPDFNRGIWKELESSVRVWAKKEHKIIVVTGPVFKDNKGSIGKDKVLVPGYFYKLILDLTGEPRIVAFLLPNEKSDRPIKDFAVSTDEVERLTGFDYFAELPDSLETKLESRVELAGWFDGYTVSEPVAVKSPQKTSSSNSDLKFYLILIGAILLVVIFVSVRNKKRNS